MKCLYKTVLFLFASLSLFNLSCSTITYKDAFPMLVDGKYDSEFPYRNCSQQLEEISESIKFLNSIAYYKSYSFKEDSKVRTSDITSDIIEEKSIRSDRYEITAAGTATVIYNTGNKIAVVTCAHVVNFEDTVYVFYRDKEGYLTPFLQSISIKEKQNNYISDMLNGDGFDIFAIDNNLDIAVLGKDFGSKMASSLKVFQYPWGSAKDLEWGTFVYVFGYPMGYKTLTKALVSSPNKDRFGSFILDAVFNRGFSGGIILAVKDGVPNFEFVGMIKSIPTEYEYILKPSSGITGDTYNPLMPYSGELYVERRPNIKYGITKAVPVESIKEFLSENLINFKERGFDFTLIASKK